MSTSPSDDVVNLLSRYLARHLSEGDLLSGLDCVENGELGGESGELVGELIDELRTNGHGRPFVEVLVRETLEALALGA
jgi:hypothetical protein